MNSPTKEIVNELRAVLNSEFDKLTTEFIGGNKPNNIDEAIYTEVKSDEEGSPILISEMGINFIEWFKRCKGQLK